MNDRDAKPRLSTGGGADYSLRNRSFVRRSGSDNTNGGSPSGGEGDDSMGKPDAVGPISSDHAAPTFEIRCKGCGATHSDELRLIETGFHKVGIYNGQPVPMVYAETVCEECLAHLDVLLTLINYEGAEN